MESFLYTYLLFINRLNGNQYDIEIEYLYLIEQIKINKLEFYKLECEQIIKHLNSFMINKYKDLTV